MFGCCRAPAPPYSCVHSATHATPEIPVILTPSALWTCLIHPDALLLVGVLIGWRLLTAAGGGPTWTACRSLGLLGMVSLGGRGDVL
ncbi:hypothetical protein PGIGA_G00075630 [Pangasianodon gigas]|uniref:Uncharacterized protein n=1 Tax=Pangasianodon gigas TaxID=30993 RepID=A0ACC5X8C3_PANGG|nr:hypothetical protein [Pangasianodon gigas]